MENVAQICQILKTKDSESSDFYDKFQQVAKNIEGFCFLFYFHIQSVAKIWLNHLIDDHHFSQMTKLGKKTLSEGSHLTNVMVE